MTTPNNYDVTSHSYLHQVNTLGDEIYGIENASMMCGNYDPIELSYSDVKHLLNGGALIDLSDGEFIHAFKLSDKAIKQIKNRVTAE